MINYERRSILFGAVKRGLLLKCDTMHIYGRLGVDGEKWSGGVWGLRCVDDSGRTEEK